MEGIVIVLTVLYELQLLIIICGYCRGNRILAFFYGLERSMFELKYVFVCSLFKWCIMIGEGVSCNSLVFFFYFLFIFIIYFWYVVIL